MLQHWGLGMKQKLSLILVFSLLGIFLITTAVIKLTGEGSIALSSSQSQSDKLIREKEKININKASPEELADLEGIGRISAERIVEYRERNGRFKNTRDICKVQGIGEKTYLRIKDKIET